MTTVTVSTAVAFEDEITIITGDRIKVCTMFSVCLSVCRTPSLTQNWNVAGSS